MSEISSHKQILRSSTIIGGASVINIVIGLLRNKLVAVMLGPAGVGLIGLLQNLIGTASTLASLGFGNVGTRQIAEAAGREDGDEVVVARSALFWGTLVLALVGAGIFWLFRGVLADKIMDDSRLSSTIGWLSMGVALNVAAGSQGALLNGLRRIGDLARVSVWSALLSTLLGLVALWGWGNEGVLAFVLSVPLASFLTGHFYVARLPKMRALRASSLTALFAQWRTLARLGIAFMVAALVGTLGQLLVRMFVQKDLGTAALGHFQAAWSISMTYIGFVLAAMSTDYYPRLTAVVRDHSVVNRLVNEQTEVVLLLAGPVLVAMIGLAPWVIELLYSGRFAEATTILRWQVLGDVLKVVSWPLAFIILAAGDGRTYVLVESLAMSVFTMLAWIGLPLVRVEATGIAFVGMYAVYLPVVFFLARRRTVFSWTRRVSVQIAIVSGFAVFVFVCALWSKWLGAGLGIVAAIGLGVYGLDRLTHLANLGGPLGQAAAFFRRIRTSVWHD